MSKYLPAPLFQMTAASHCCGNVMERKIVEMDQMNPMTAVSTGEREEGGRVGSGGGGREEGGKREEGGGR